MAIHGSQCQQILSIPLVLVKAPLLSYSGNREKLSTVLYKINTSCTTYIIKKVRSPQNIVFYKLRS